MTATASVPPARSNFHVLAKPIGPICNLACTYCFYLEKERLYPNTTSWAMPDAVLETFIREHITSQEIPVISFGWQGGEPTLLGLGFFQRVVELQRRYANGKRIENSFQTNGVLLDDDWCEFLARHGFLVGLSIDGPEPLHDRYRLSRGGKPTFREVVRGASALERHGVAFNTLTVVNRVNADHPLDVYRFLREHGSGYLQFIPVVERVRRDGLHEGFPLPGTAGEGQVTPWSVGPRQLGAFLCAVFDEWVRHDVGRVFVQHVDVALENWYAGDTSLCLFKRTCGRALAIEHNGDVYSCDHYVFPPYRLGNVTEVPLASLVESPAQSAFGLAKETTLPRYCQTCDVLFACHGECPKNRFGKTPDGEGGLNYLCAGYQQFFRHIDPPMRFMADQLRRQQPPASVMAWVRHRDLATAGRLPGRNAPCPCGSGRKYKRCCGTQASSGP